MARRILIVSSQVRSVHSGVGTYAATILAGITGSDLVDVTVATWGDELAEDRYPGLEWIPLGGKPGRDPTPGKFWTLGRRLAAALQDRAFDFDVVHFLDVREGHAFVATDLAARAEVIGTVHDDYAARVTWNPFYYLGRAADPFKRFAFHRWLRRLEARTYPKFDRLLVNSRETGRVVREAYGLDEARMTPVTLTIDPTHGDAVQSLDGEPSLVFCGGNFYRKGLDTCVEAMPTVRVEKPGARLHVLGSCGSQPRIEALARRLGVHDALEFHGHVPPDVAAARMAGADLFVMPSRTEALGLVYLEAFRAGVPVLAGDRGGVTEIVRDGESGLLVPPEDHDALAAAILRLASDGELRRHLVAGGRAVLADRTRERLRCETLSTYGLPADSLAAAARTRAAQDEEIRVDADLGAFG